MMSRMGARDPPTLKAGVRAPDFTLKTTPDQSVSLKDCRQTAYCLRWRS